MFSIIRKFIFLKIKQLKFKTNIYFIDTDFSALSVVKIYYWYHNLYQLELLDKNISK